ncbi:MAG: NADPH-dependent oxidoreductase [Anaerolineaceae bacterium 4572_5.2]|nr:MAG: NADPH-dependent oxidoreductase [Anaerolineaceae bacterium 4572_5.2]
MEKLDFITQHRSIRKYKPDPIAGETLNDILDAGIRASSSGNMQSYSIIVSRKQSLRKRLFYALREQKMTLQAPVYLTFCADFNRMRKWLALNNAPDNFDDFLGFMVAAIDAVLVSQNVALAAETKGLGICYIGSTLAHCEEVAQILELPQTVMPVVGFTLGYPAENPPLRDRLPLDGLVHHETYQDYTPQRVAQIYAKRDKKGWERYMALPQLRQKAQEAGVENLAQLYTTVKYTKPFHQELSAEILNFLKKQGFLKAEG